jgi:hypothetical protein
MRRCWEAPESRAKLDEKITDRIPDAAKLRKPDADQNLSQPIRNLRKVRIMEPTGPSIFSHVSYVSVSYVKPRNSEQKSQKAANRPCGQSNCD